MHHSASLSLLHADFLEKPHVKWVHLFSYSIGVLPVLQALQDHGSEAAYIEGIRHNHGLDLRPDPDDNSAQGSGRGGARGRGTPRSSKVVHMCCECLSSCSITNLHSLVLNCLPPVLSISCELDRA